MVVLSNTVLLAYVIVYRGPITPTMPKHGRFGLFPGRSPLLGESLLFSFPAGTKMFQFPALASIKGCQCFILTGCPIRKSVGQRSFAPNHSLSQLITSFIASESQGIHRMPLFTSFIYHTVSHQGTAAVNILMFCSTLCFVCTICQ